MAPPSPVTRTLYRCLLRTARRFTQDPVLTSLLHRTGIETGKPDVWDPAMGPYRAGGDSWGRGGGDDIPEEELRSVHLPPENAMDLTRGYDELRRRHYRRTRAALSRAGDEAAGPEGGSEGGGRGEEMKEKEGGGSGGDPILEIVGRDGIEEYVVSKIQQAELAELAKRPPAHMVLYRRLLADVMGGREVQMRFPSQIVADGQLGRLEDVIRREFRAPSLGKGLDGAVAAAAEGEGEVPPVSSYFDDGARREAGFLALKQLGKKVAWAASLGGGGGGGVKSSASKAKTEDEHRTAPRHEARERSRESDGGGDNVVDDEERTRQWHRRQAALDVSPLPTSPPSSYLRPGSYLVAHPLFPRYSCFARSVIAILDHTDDRRSTGAAGGGNGGAGAEGGGEAKGGTYGLIINRESFAPLPNGSGDRRRPRCLREVLRLDCMPDELRRAFGDVIVREGGPVHESVQMLRVASPEVEERLGIGGMVLPMIVDDGEEPTVEGGIGGSADEGTAAAAAAAARSAAVDTDSTIYFDGDLIRAARAVLEGDMDRDDFSFVVGASAWAPGQLEREIKYGFWLPCRGPPQMALMGMCEHMDVDTNSDAVNKGSSSGKGRKGPPRPKSDLWLSMMCAIGEEEAKLAHLMLDEENDENGEACDDF